MPFCTTCGANVTGAFCPQCGTPISAAASAPPPPVQQPSMQPPPYQAQPYGTPPPGAPRKISPLAWVLIVILGLCFLGFASCAAFGLFVAHKVKEAGNNPGLAVAKFLAAANPNV